MEASSSTSHQPPATPSHPSLLPALSPNSETTPAPLHTLPSHLQHHMGQPPPPQPRLGTPMGSSSAQNHGSMGPPGNGQLHQQQHQQHQQQSQMPIQGQGVFNTVMGNAPGQHPTAGPGYATAKVYASVYSGIPVFEAMIRGISVMRRSADSWVNATQILKVAGISKSGRTKILEKEILTGLHEKVQGGYGKYQGTWIPFQRGQELAVSYGVDEYLSPIFDFVPSPSAVAALPVIRHGTPPGDRTQRTPNISSNLNPNSSRTPAQASGSNRMISPFTQGHHAPPPPYVNGDVMMGIPPHPSAMAYAQGQPMYYQAPNPYGNPQDNQMVQGGMGMEMTPSHSGGGLAPAPDINGIGLPPSNSEVYLDQYGNPLPIHVYGNGDIVDSLPKRARPEEGYTNGEAEEAAEDDDDDDSVDELRNAPPLPTSMRLATKPLRPKASSATSKARTRLLNLFSAEDPIDVRAILDIPLDQPADFDLDMVIDDRGHTALHWACALAKSSVIAQLIELGADIYRGNYAGETPLVRSILTTNHAEAGTFSDLLEHWLSPSIRTLDHAYRSVLHHIALIAGIKGRASSARVYMAGVLEWIARERNSAATELPSATGNPSSLSLKALVDVQDVHGDTALNVAARVGNRGLVKLLLDAGADKAKANKLNLLPVNFGVESEALKVSPAEAAVSNLKSEVTKPEKQSRDVQKNIAALFETINETFSNEMLTKQTKLNAIEASVRHATKALADKRQQVQRLQTSLSELEQLEQKTQNVQRALELTSEEWSGQSLLFSELSGLQSVNPAFRPYPHGNIAFLPGTELGEDVPLPEREDEDALIQLRRVAVWEDRVAELLEQRIADLEGESSDRAVKYRKLVALCAKVPVEKVDGMLDGLTTAIESDGQSIDLSRISNFMSRMKETQV